MFSWPRFLHFFLAVSVLCRAAGADEAFLEVASEEEGREAAAETVAPVPGDGEIRLLLEDAVRMALENNIQIQISREDDSVRQREIVQARAVFDPFFNMGLTYAKNRDPTVSVIDIGGAASQGLAINPSEQTSYSVGLSGEWVLGTQYSLEVAQVQTDSPAASDGGITSLNPITNTQASLDLRQPLLKGAWYEVNTAEIRIAQNDAAISLDELERIAMDTIFEVESAYWEVVFGNQDVAAKQKALVVARENLENVRKKQNVGTLAAIDVTTAKHQVELRQVDLARAELVLENSQDRLLDLLNLSGRLSLKQRWEQDAGAVPYDSLKLNCTTEANLDEEVLGRDDALRLAFSRRPDYRQISLNVKNQEIRTFVARNDLLPSLDVLARWTQLGLEDDYDESYSELNGGRFYDWLVGVEFSVPLSNRAPRARYRNSRSEVRRLLLQKKELENQIMLAVDRALREIRSLGEQAKFLEAAVEDQEALLEAERRRYEVGTGVAYQVSQIENDLVDQETQLLRTQANLQKAKAELLHATGSTLRKYRVVVGFDGR